ncbi:hypothetical protein HK098_001066, partial [Nowakowskiella sp. JEL0407]
LGLQILFTYLTLTPPQRIKLLSLPWYIYFISLVVCPVAVIPVQEVVKKHDLKELQRFQKWSELKFNTKL